MLSENITKWIVMQAELSEGNEVIIRYGLKRIKMLDFISNVDNLAATVVLSDELNATLPAYNVTAPFVGVSPLTLLTAALSNVVNA